MNELKEYLKRELGITDEQYEQLVKEKQEQSPMNDLNNIALVEALQMQNLNDLSNMVAMLMMKVAELEGKVNA
ncbi:hypothetical protein [Bacillus sp. 1P02SD]|uniref:hypothetical protein n=1 Tax=Bacillus sp. 1P02SD TaxID=3132264 RepID=UPI0039A059D8